MLEKIVNRNGILCRSHILPTGRQHQGPKVKTTSMNPWRLMSTIFIFYLALASNEVRADSIIRESIRIPVSYQWGFETHKVEHEALVVRPSGPGPFPLVVVSHGTPRSKGDWRANKAEFARQRPDAYLPVANEFARMGFAAVIFMRRATGKQVETSSISTTAIQRAKIAIRHSISPARRPLRTTPVLSSSYKRCRTCERTLSSRSVNPPVGWVSSP